MSNGGFLCGQISSLNEEGERKNMNRTLALIFFAMLVAGCAARGYRGEAERSMAAQLVLSRTWHWESTTTPVERIAVPNPERYII